MLPIKYHNVSARWLWSDEAICLFGFATGRVSYEPKAKHLYSFRLFLGLFKLELLWTMGKPTFNET